MALIIAGERSGVGKTTVTLALLSFLARQGDLVQSFKVGPDYIDPMFHRAITDRPCRNLDPFLTSESYVRSCFSRHCQDVDYALVEGVMGLFDGISSDGLKDFASTAHIARLLDLPVLLVLDCSRLSRSVAAIAHGYRTFDPRVKLAGVVLNRVGSDRHLDLLRDALEPLNLPILGVLRRHDAITIPDRHLGLIPTAELDFLDPLFDRLAELAANCFDWNALLPLLLSSPSQCGRNALRPYVPSPLKIAIACDRAFNFYYQDNLDLLQQLGAELIPWSPMTDAELPEGVRGLYFGGGFPEVWAEQLADNTPVREAVRDAIKAGMPAYGECGGLMYLCDRLVDFSGKSWEMVGILTAEAVMGKKLTLGYREAKALQNNFLLPEGETIRAHEFHRSELTSVAKRPLFAIPGDRPSRPVLQEGWRFKNLQASYLHLHFGEYPSVPQNFLARCLAFSEKGKLS